MYSIFTAFTEDLGSLVWPQAAPWVVVMAMSKCDKRATVLLFYFFSFYRLYFFNAYSSHAYPLALCFNRGLRHAGDIHLSVSNQWKVSTGLGDGLTVNRRQTIIWIDAGPIHWHIISNSLKYIPTRCELVDNFTKPLIFQNPFVDIILAWFLESVLQMCTLSSAST